MRCEVHFSMQKSNVERDIVTHRSRPVNGVLYPLQSLQTRARHQHIVRNPVYLKRIGRHGSIGSYECLKRGLYASTTTADNRDFTNPIMFRVCPVISKSKTATGTSLMRRANKPESSCTTVMDSNTTRPISTASHFLRHFRLWMRGVLYTTCSLAPLLSSDHLLHHIFGG